MDTDSLSAFPGKQEAGLHQYQGGNALKTRGLCFAAQCDGNGRLQTDLDLPPGPCCLSPTLPSHSCPQGIPVPARNDRFPSPRKAPKAHHCCKQDDDLSPVQNRGLTHCSTKEEQPFLPLSSAKAGSTSTITGELRLAKPFLTPLVLDGPCVYGGWEGDGMMPPFPYCIAGNPLGHNHAQIPWLNWLCSLPIHQAFHTRELLCL